MTKFPPRNTRLEEEENSVSLPVCSCCLLASPDYCSARVLIQLVKLYQPAWYLQLSVAGVKEGGRGGGRPQCPLPTRMIDNTRTVGLLQSYQIYI